MADSVGNFGQSIGSAANVGAPPRSRVAPDDDVSLFAYWFLLKSRWRFIAACALLAAIASGLISELVMTRYYQATAVLRPVSSRPSKRT